MIVAGNLLGREHAGIQVPRQAACRGHCTVCERLQRDGFNAMSSIPVSRTVGIEGVRELIFDSCSEHWQLAGCFTGST
jgi:hypothetical protein